MTTQGRNDKCNCGSGKKFKNCCLTMQTKVYVNPSKPVQIGEILTVMGENDWSNTIKVPVATGKVKFDNMDFELNEVIHNLVIKNNPHLADMLRFRKEDLDKGIKAPYYFYHAGVHQWQAIDTEEQFNDQMDEFEAKFKRDKESWITEKVTYTDIVINKEKFHAVEMYSISAQSLHNDPTPFQFQRFFGERVNTYYKIVA